jgi:hypothetical protein
MQDVLLLLTCKVGVMYEGCWLLLISLPACLPACLPAVTVTSFVQSSQDLP